MLISFQKRVDNYNVILNEFEINENVYLCVNGKYFTILSYDSQPLELHFVVRDDMSFNVYLLYKNFILAIYNAVDKSYFYKPNGDKFYLF